MACRKRTTINIKDLDAYPTLKEELQNDSINANRDFDTLKLTVLDDYQAKIKNIDEKIANLERYVSANKDFIKTYKDEQLINRIQLTKMLRISRQTLTSWINKRLITPTKSKYVSEVGTFNTDSILKELRKHKTIFSDK